MCIWGSESHSPRDPLSFTSRQIGPRQEFGPEPVWAGSRPQAHRIVSGPVQPLLSADLRPAAPQPNASASHTKAGICFPCRIPRSAVCRSSHKGPAPRVSSPGPPGAPACLAWLGVSWCSLACPDSVRPAGWTASPCPPHLGPRQGARGQPASSPFRGTGIGRPAQAPRTPPEGETS